MTPWQEGGAISAEGRARERAPDTNRKASASMGDTGFPLMAALRGAGEGGSFGCALQQTVSTVAVIGAPA